MPVTPTMPTATTVAAGSGWPWPAPWVARALRVLWPTHMARAVGAAATAEGGPRVLARSWPKRLAPGWMA